MKNIKKFESFGSLDIDLDDWFDNLYIENKFKFLNMEFDKSNSDHRAADYEWDEMSDSEKKDVFDKYSIKEEYLKMIEKLSDKYSEIGIELEFAVSDMVEGFITDNDKVKDLMDRLSNSSDLLELILSLKDNN